MKTCPLCGVRITDRGEVLFSHGKPGTKQRLLARVCQFVQNRDDKKGCINELTMENCTPDRLDYYD